MNPSPPIPDGHLAYKDAVCISPHKFVGGPGTPGVLVAKRALFTNPVPDGARRRHRSSSSARRGSPTTPSPRSARRAERRRSSSRSAPGWSSGSRRPSAREEIRRREDDFARRALSRGGATRSIEILGNPDLERLAIISLGLRHPRGLLHANFVVAVLSDLFGIQARSGCFCAGPYIHRMYPIDERLVASAWTPRSPAATWAPSSPSCD